MEDNNQQKKNGPIFLKTPKGYVTILLIIISTLSFFGVDMNTVFSQIQNIVIAVATGVILDVLIATFQERKKISFDGAIITGLIVAMILGSDTHWYILSATTAIALATKHVLKIKRKPLFNPAALGLLISIPLFSSNQSWWGGLPNLPIWCVLFLITAGYIITDRVNKFPQVFAFLGVYIGLSMFMSFFGVHGIGDIFRSPFINTALFFAFFMLTDPPTSPATQREQITFGAIVAVIGAIVFATSGGLAYLLIGLCIANAWNAYISYNKVASTKKN